MINDATDILNALHDRQWLLVCLEKTLNDLYYDADQKATVGLNKIATVLDAYNNAQVTAQLKTAIALLSESV